MHKFKVIVTIQQYYYENGKRKTIPFTTKRNIPVTYCEYSDAIVHSTSIANLLFKGPGKKAMERFPVLKIPTQHQVTAIIEDDLFLMTIAIEQHDNEISMTMATDKKGRLIHFVSGKVIEGLESQKSTAELEAMLKYGAFHWIQPSLNHEHPN